MKSLLTFAKYAFLLAFCLGLDACRRPKDPQPQGIVVAVKDKFTQKAIPNATVKWAKAELSGSGSTDKDGIYRKDGMAIGRYTVIVTANDYKLERAGKDMNIEVGAMSNETFELTPETLEITPKNITFSDGEKAKTVYFKNKNTQSSITLSIEVPQKDDWVKVSNPSLTIPAGSQKDITVTVDTKGRGFGSYNSTVTLNFTINGRPDNDEFNVYMVIANPQAPSISTDVPTGISQTSADVRCTVTNIGGSAVTDRGIYVSESSDPKASNSQKVSMGPGGIGSFVATAKNLKSGGRYFARGYTINSFGEGLGEVREFTTAIEPTPPTLAMNPVLEKDVSLNTAVVSAKITSDGGSPIKEQGFVINTTGNPTVNDNKIQTNADANGNMSQNLTNLTQNTTYYTRAYAINSLNKVGYSEPHTSFKTKVPVVASEVTTLAATDINDNSAKLQGEIAVLGSSPIEQHGFCISSTNSEPNINSTSVSIRKGQRIATGKFEHVVTNLTKGVNFYVRAYVTTKDGTTYYGETKEVVTTESGLLLYYPFNGNFIDMITNGNNATANLKFANDKDGNQARAYDLSSGPIVVNNTRYIGGFKGDFTIALWTKISESNFTGDPKHLISKFAGCYARADDDGYYVYTDSQTKTLSFYVVADGNKNTFPLMKQTELSSNKWHHIVFTKSGRNLRFYFNGSFYATYRADFDSVNEPVFSDFSVSSLTAASLRLGNYGACGNTTNFNGLIDEFRIYNYPMTDTQVEELFKR